LLLIFPGLRSETGGTQILGLRGKGFELGLEGGVDGAAIELGEAEVAVEADAGEESFACCGVECGWQRAYSTIS